MKTGTWVVAGTFILCVLFACALYLGGFYAWFVFYFAFLFFAYERFVSTYGSRSIQIRRHVPKQRVWAGEPVAVELTVSRKHRFPLGWVRVVDTLSQPAGLSEVGRQEGTGVCTLQPMWKGTQNITYSINGLPRGHHRLPSVTVETEDLLGIAGRQRLVPSDNRLLVYPRIAPVKGWGTSPTASIKERVRPGGRTAGAHSDIFTGVRPYRDGDRMNHIHWATSARRDSLQTKEFEPERSHEFLVLLNLSGASFPEGTGDLLELELSVAASLLYHIHRNRQVATLYHVNLLKESRFTRCMDVLAGAQASEPRPFEDTLCVLVERAVKKSIELPGPCVVVSPYVEAKGIMAIHRLSKTVPVEWFIPTTTPLRPEQAQMLQTLRGVRVYALHSEQQLSSLGSGGFQHATMV